MAEAAYLVQLLLPRYDESVARELTERFGGVTAYARAGASSNGASSRKSS